MKQEKIDSFLMNNQKYFESSQIPMIVETLQSMDDESYMYISSSNYKDPTTMLLFSLFLGELGVDRFLLGEIGMGVLKLLTFGCLGILTIIDWCTIISKTRRFNYGIFMNNVNFKNHFPTNSSASNTEKLQNNVEIIKKLKQMLDQGIITQEEFEAKKEELLK